MAVKFTKNDLYRMVDNYNKVYCRNTKNKLCVQGAYGGWKVGLTGKLDNRVKKGFKWRKGSIGSGVADVTYGFVSPSKTIDQLYEISRTGELERKIKRWEKYKRY